jgi:hypothetical protein
LYVIPPQAGIQVPLIRAAQSELIYNIIVKIELVPTLDLCIEGTARQEYLKSADEYMQRSRKDRKLEEKIELLRMFLETADFRKLRAESEKHLVEGKKVRFILTSEKGKPQYEVKCE